MNTIIKKIIRLEVFYFLATIFGLVMSGGISIWFVLVGSGLFGLWIFIIANENKN